MLGLRARWDLRRKGEGGEHRVLDRMLGHRQKGEGGGENDDTLSTRVLKRVLMETEREERKSDVEMQRSKVLCTSES